jgi:hypothetical protein
MDNWLNAKNKPNQTQFKPKTNPMPKTVVNARTTPPSAEKPPSGGHKNKPNSNPTPKMNLSPYLLRQYRENPPAAPAKTNPNKPNLSEPPLRSLSWDNQSSSVIHHSTGKANKNTLKIHPFDIHCPMVYMICRK